MKYYIDTEFLEGPQEKRFFGFKTGKKTKNTIDLISIGIVAEDGREYYAISKDFNLKEAWSRYDEVVNKHYPLGPEYNKVYWIRENVLKPIWKDLRKNQSISNRELKFTYKSLKTLIYKYGKTNNQIAEEIKTFINEEPIKIIKSSNMTILTDESRDAILRGYVKPEFYAYYADYDWVAFCWLFGKMIDLPKGFPMYCRDLKQFFDEKAESFTTKQLTDFQYGEGYMKHDVYAPLNYMKVDYTKVDLLKKHKNYPKQTKEHNALADAKWNRDLYKFLNNL